MNTELLTMRGMQMAVEMFGELESKATVNAEGSRLADLCQLEAEYRYGGEPFRNIVAERLENARQLGAYAEAGFCAVLSHLVAVGAQGFELKEEPLQEIITAAQVDACGVQS